MKWCIPEGLQADLSSPGLPANMVPRFPGQHGDGLLPTPVHFPFGPVPPALQSITMPNDALFPAGANIPQMQGRGMNARRGRGPNSKQPVSGVGGQLEVAGEYLLHAGAVTKLDVAIATRSALLLEVRHVLRWGGPVGVVGFFFLLGDDAMGMQQFVMCPGQ